ncbi:aminotransferase class IV, partial [Bacteroidota bacterium]
NYLNTFRLSDLKKEKGALDILYFSEHGITECPRDNFFIFKNDILITPKDFILWGITRKIVLQLAEKQYAIEERRIDPQELKEADETFVTSTTKNIIPIVRIDDTIIGNGKIGDGTKNIMNLFNTYTQNYNR